MRKYVSWLIASLLCTALLFFAGCSKEEEPGAPGPAEKIGREIDKAVQEASEQARQMKKKLGEELEQTGKEMQKPEEKSEEAGSAVRR